MKENCTQFEPSELQQRLLTAVQDSEYSVTIKQACSDAGISRTNWYSWGLIEGFCDWWNAARERYFTRRLAEVDSAAFRAAIGEVSGPEAGSAADRRLLLERYDVAFKPSRRVEASGDLRVSHGASEAALLELTKNVERILGDEAKAEAEAEDRKPEGE